MGKFGLGGGFGGGGQVESELGEFSRFAGDRNGATIAADHADADAQAQSGAFAHVFGGEKWIENFCDDFRVNARTVVADGNHRAVAFGTAGDRDGRFLLQVELFAFQCVNRIFQQVDQHHRKVVPADPNLLLGRDVQFQGNIFILQATGNKAPGVIENGGQINGLRRLLAGMGEVAEALDDFLHAINPVLDVGENRVKFRAHFRGQIAAFFMEREQAGFGIVQRVENVVHEAGAEAAEGGQFFSLDELGLGLLDFVVGLVQGDVLLAQLGVEDFQVAVAFFKVMFAFVQFVAKSKFPKPQQVVKMTADDYENTGYKQKVDVIKKDALVKSG